MDKKKILVRERTACAPLSIVTREDGSESRTVEGYAIMFGVESDALWEDEDGKAVEVIAPEAVTRELLDASDIKMTMFHNREKILARSNNGAGTLSYEIDEKGVKFRFDAPQTALGDEALELVRRGDIAGCSFAFGTRYYDESCVKHEVQQVDSKTVELFTVRSILGVYDFTLAADPAYPQTSVTARELRAEIKEKREEIKEKSEERERGARVAAQVAAMRGNVIGNL